MTQPTGDDAGFDLKAKQSRPYAFIQWKGTDVCMDVHCECGTHFHHDGFFAYTVECDGCGAVWEMPQILFPRKVTNKDTPTGEKP